MKRPLPSTRARLPGILAQAWLPVVFGRAPVSGRFAPASLSVLALAASCTGSIAQDGEDGQGPRTPAGEPGGRPAAGGRGGGTPVTPMTAPGTTATPVIPAGPESAGPMPLRRLSRLEYNNTVRDLLGDTSRPALVLPEEGLGSSGFAETGKVSDVEARRLGEAADAVAAAAVKDLPKLMGCNPAANETACVAQFLAGFGKRAYRRPITALEVSELQAFFRSARMRHDVAGSVGLLVTAMLQSPNFLYHWEVPEGAATREGALVRLGGYELASRLSYFLWRSMPDDALFAAAEAGKLKTPEEIVTHARRMLADKRARDTIADFHLQWAHVDFREVDKDRQAYPLWTSALAGAMVEETRSFVGNVLTKGDGKLTTLLTSPVSYVNASLARLYGASGVTGTDLKETTLDGNQRGGLFTLGGFLAAQGAEAGSHPIKRGKVIWEGVVCGVIPPPPMNVPPPKAATPNLSTRERFAEHSKNECAAACHALFDPPGFAFENYDGIGQWRTTDGGKGVDASGTLKLPIAGEKPFKNAVDMMQVLATSEDARRCAVTQWLRYALGRHEVEGDGGSLGRIYEAFRASEFDVRELLVAIAKSKTFLYRQPAAGEVL